MSDWRWLGSILGSILRLEWNRTSLAAAASLRRGECKRGCKMNKMSLFRRNVTKCHVRRKIESSAIIQIDFRLDSTSRTSLDKACLQGPRGQTFCTSQFLHHFLPSQIRSQRTGSPKSLLEIEGESPPSVDCGLLLKLFSFGPRPYMIKR